MIWARTYFLIILTCMGWGGSVWAQSFEDGYQEYLRNRFPIAEVKFKDALKLAKTQEDKALYLKFIGICQYMRGDRPAATSSFQQAVLADKKIAIDEEEVLDSQIISFFNAIKEKSLTEDQASSATTSSPSVSKNSPRAKSGAKSAEQVTGRIKENNPSRQRFKASEESVFGPEKQGKKARKVAHQDLTDSNSTSPSQDVSKTNELGKSFRLAYLLPFGAGQFANNSNVLGSAFALAEMAVLYNAFFVLQKDIEEKENRNKIVESGNYTVQDKATFLQANNEYIDGVKKKQTQNYIAFGALAITSSLQAVLYSNASSSGSRRSSAGTDSDPKQFASGDWSSGWLPDKNGGKWVINWAKSVP